MASSTTIRSPYERRVELITDTITENSKLKPGAARDLAIHVLQAINGIPETMR